MKKRSDKIIALLLCAFMAFSLIAAAADDSVESPVEDKVESSVETPAETTVETPAEPTSTPEPEAPAETEPAQDPAPTEPPAATEPPAEAEPEDEPVALKESSINGDTNGMNFTVAGLLPEGSKLQVTAIDLSCNDYIVGNYLSDVALPQGVAMAFELTILTVEEQDGVEQKTVYVPTAANGLTVTVSGSKEDCFSAMSVYHLPGVAAKQVETAVKALAEGEVSPEELPAARPAALDADGNPLRYYNQMNVSSYLNGDKKLFTFPADGLSVFYLVAEVSAEHSEGCTGEGCTMENCPCQCHSLYARLLACKTLEELDALLEAATDDELAALSEGQKQQIEAKVVALEPEPLPPVVLEEFQDEPVPSEIVYLTVNYSWVAPFGSPVAG